MKLFSFIVNIFFEIDIYCDIVYLNCMCNLYLSLVWMILNFFYIYFVYEEGKMINMFFLFFKDLVKSIFLCIFVLGYEIFSLML